MTLRAPPPSSPGARKSCSGLGRGGNDRVVAAKVGAAVRFVKAVQVVKAVKVIKTVKAVKGAKWSKRSKF